MTLISLGVGESKGSGAVWSGQRGGTVVVLTGLWGAGALRAGLWSEVGCAGSRSGFPSARPWVGGRGWVGDGLEVKTESVDCIFGLGSQLYTTINYASFV